MQAGGLNNFWELTMPSSSLHSDDALDVYPTSTANANNTPVVDPTSTANANDTPVVDPTPTAFKFGLRVLVREARQPVHRSLSSTQTYARPGGKDTGHLSEEPHERRLLGRWSRGISR